MIPEADRECLIVNHSFACGNDMVTELCRTFASKGIERPGAVGKRTVLYHIIRRLTSTDRKRLSCLMFILTIIKVRFSIFKNIKTYICNLKK
jgi:hypothetical protein